MSNPVFLIEVRTVDKNGFVDGLLFVKLIRASGFKIAFATAARLSKETGHLFLIQANNLNEIIDGYMWAGGEQQIVYEVRLLPGRQP